MAILMFFCLQASISGFISFYFTNQIHTFLSQQFFLVLRFSSRANNLVPVIFLTSVRVRTSQLDLHRRIQPRRLDACADPSRACGVSESCRKMVEPLVNPRLGKPGCHLENRGGNLQEDRNLFEITGVCHLKLEVSVGRYSSGLEIWIYNNDLAPFTCKV